MAKKNKFGKVLAVTAIVGTATAAVVAYLHRSGMFKTCKSMCDDFDSDEDMGFLDEDFEFPEEDEDSATREYITINKKDESEESPEKEEESEETKDVIPEEVEDEFDEEISE